MRIIYLPGFGETAKIFDGITPHIEGEAVFINHWELLGNQVRRELNVLVYAKELIEQFGIEAEDILIGHSMGGWIGYHIKHLVGCKVVQIGSWTEVDRMVLPIKNRKVIYFLTWSGLYLNNFTKTYSIKRGYKGKPSEGIFGEIFDDLIRRSKGNVLNQLRVVLNHINEQVAVSPDLRIHARGDVTIRIPKADFIEVQGDHFTLWTHPEEVYGIINRWLEGNGSID